MWLTSFIYLIFVFMIKIQISVQQDGQTSNNENKDIILNIENHLDAKLADLQRKISNHLEDEISRIIDNKLKSHIRRVSDYVDEKLELMEKSLRNVSDDLAQSLTENFTKSLENTRLTIMNVLGKVDGSWGSWGSWSSCDVSCGGGVRQRRRLCDEPAPAYTGQPCMGSDTEEEHCNENACPVDGGWSYWSSWGPCSAYCGTSNRRRYRYCSEPIPAHGGQQCDGDKTQEDNCNTESCPIDDDECPVSEGFFKVPGGEHCYKFFDDELRSWPEADTKCKSEGLALAEPVDDIVLALRRYIVDHRLGSEFGKVFGGFFPILFTRVGGRYDGSRTFRFVRNQAEPLQANNTLWGSEEPYPDNLNENGCLYLVTNIYFMSEEPNTAYRTSSCDWGCWTLCEDVKP